MKFLIVSQRANPNPDYKLNDLTAHGRIDVIFRCILAAGRTLFNSEPNAIYCYLKGSEDETEWGWIKWEEMISDHDEVSIAAEVKKRWNQIFSYGPLNDLMESLDCDEVIYLHEEGEMFNPELKPVICQSNHIIVLGAQSDLSPTDLSIIRPTKIIKLTEKSILASQAIVLFRQFCLF